LKTQASFLAKKILKKDQAVAKEAPEARIYLIVRDFFKRNGGIGTIDEAYKKYDKHSHKDNKLSQAGASRGFRQGLDELAASIADEPDLVALVGDIEDSRAGERMIEIASDYERMPDSEKVELGRRASDPDYRKDIDDERKAWESTEEGREAINEYFNEELERQVAGTLPKDHVYRLGNPREVLQKAGIPDLPIEMNAATLAKKADPNYKNSHPFELSEIKGLPNAIQDPIMIFDSKTRKDSKVILTELKSKGVNFVVAMEMNHKVGSNRTGVIEINSIRSVYPKDQVKDIITWSRDGLLKYANKEKASVFMKELRSQFPQTSFTNAEAYMDNIIKNLEDGKGKSENKEKALTT